jgi:hypothetical protein
LACVTPIVGDLGARVIAFNGFQTPPHPLLNIPLRVRSQQAGASGPGASQSNSIHDVELCGPGDGLGRLDGPKPRGHRRVGGARGSSTTSTTKPTNIPGHAKHDNKDATTCAIYREVC